MCLADGKGRKVHGVIENIRIPPPGAMKICSKFNEIPGTILVYLMVLSFDLYYIDNIFM